MKSFIFSVEFVNTIARGASSLAVVKPSEKNELGGSPVPRNLKIRNWILIFDEPLHHIYVPPHCTSRNRACIPLPNCIPTTRH